MSDRPNCIPEAEAEQDVSDVLRVRQEKLRALQDSGRDPFAVTVSARDHSTSEVRERFDELEGKSVTLAGRMTARRGMGKAGFMDLSDRGGKLQVYLRQDELGIDAYDGLSLWDIGDLIEVTGEVFRTHRGEISVRAKRVRLLAKSLQPLPEKWHGLRDTDLRYRQRYLDLIVNTEVRETFVRRSRIIRYIREYLDARDYIEVETPVLCTISGGGHARPFVTHHNTLDMDMYLRVATELHLKRLIIGGMERVYEIGHDFRNEGMDVKHNPEFTMLELYEAYTDYRGMMALTEDMLSGLTQETCGTTDIEYQGQLIHMAAPWRRLTMNDAVREAAGVDFDSFPLDHERARAEAKALGLEFKADASWGDLLNLAFEEKAESSLIQPTFLCDYPVEVSPLTKRKPGRPELTERFEFFIGGREFGNAYTELNDPIDQRERFMQQLKLREQGDEEAEPMDEDFLLAMEYGMPPTGGLGVGIDRVVMLLTNSASIRDVLLFPTMKPAGSPQ